MLHALVFMSEAIQKVLRHVLTYKNYWSIISLACSPYLCSRASCPTGTLYQEYSPGSSVHPSRFWNQRFLAMSEIEPPWIANENLELYHLRFHLRSRARQLGSASTNSKSDSTSMDSTFMIHLWIFVGVSKVKVCRPKAGMHILIFNLSLLSTEF